MIISNNVYSFIQLKPQECTNFTHNNKGMFGETLQKAKEKIENDKLSIILIKVALTLA